MHCERLHKYGEIGSKVMWKQLMYSDGHNCILKIDLYFYFQTDDNNSYLSTQNWKHMLK